MLGVGRLKESKSFAAVKKKSIEGRAKNDHIDFAEFVDILVKFFSEVFANIQQHNVLLSILLNL